jgi:hypothetical protein
MHAAQSLLHMAKLPDLKVGLILIATCLHLLLPLAVSVHCKKKIYCIAMQFDAWDTDCTPISRPISRTSKLVD